VSAIPVYHMPLPTRRNGEKCFAFEWIGQPLTSCDNCGQPYWEHTHEQVHSPGQPISHHLRRVIAANQREAVRAKWETSK
jgi:hypothetical protein